MSYNRLETIFDVSVVSNLSDVRRPSAYVVYDIMESDQIKSLFNRAANASLNIQILALDHQRSFSPHNPKLDMPEPAISIPSKLGTLSVWRCDDLVREVPWIRGKLRNMDTEHRTCEFQEEEDF
jgi:hypothetical protein